MKGKFTIWYDWSWNESGLFEANAILSHDNIITAQGISWEDAKRKLIERISLIPEDEEVEIC